jgi:FkbM family methyltransferase
MGAAQFMGSLRRIAKNPHVNMISGITRHLGWQIRRLVGGFPCELALSDSVLIARDGHCGVSALVNAQGMYDFNNMKLIKLILRSGGCFIDVGANIGAFTLIASECPVAHVIAFEPHPQTFQQLQHNVRRNARCNVELVRAAVGSRSGTVTITDTPGSSTTHIVSNSGLVMHAALSVPLLRLDIALQERGVQPFVVKVDVEGFEGDVLDGLGASLREVAVLLVEMNGLADERADGSSAMTSMLHRAGFIGPLHFDALQRTFRRDVVHAGEDSVFLNLQHVPRLVTEFDVSVPSGRPLSH